MSEIVEIQKQVNVENVDERGVWFKIPCYSKPIVKCPDCGSWSLGSSDHKIDKKGVTDKEVTCFSKCGFSSKIKLLNYG